MLNNLPTPYDLGYFQKKLSRTAIKPRSIRNRLEAWNLDARYYDGDRENGYGGFHNDGRWNNLVAKLKIDFRIDSEDAVVDLGCKKGFILQAFRDAGHVGSLLGIENHGYPVQYVSPGVCDLRICPYYEIDVESNSVGFLIAFSSIYMQNIGDIVKTLKEIQRVSHGRSHVTLGAYYDDRSKKIFEDWTLIGTTVLHVNDWVELMNYAGYTGTYFFTTSDVLGLE